MWKRIRFVRLPARADLPCRAIAGSLPSTGLVQQVRARYLLGVIRFVPEAEGCLAKRSARLGFRRIWFREAWKHVSLKLSTGAKIVRESRKLQAANCRTTGRPQHENEVFGKQTAARLHRSVRPCRWCADNAVFRMRKAAGICDSGDQDRFPTIVKKLQEQPDRLLGRMKSIPSRTTGPPDFKLFPNCAPLVCMPLLVTSLDFSSWCRVRMAQ